MTHLDARTRRALRRGLTVQVWHGWRKPAETAQPAGPCFVVDPVSGLRTGTVIRVPAAWLRLTGKQPFAFQRPVWRC
ncbi:hypothetical protein [Bradyrhizobium diazoefficiens]